MVTDHHGQQAHRICEQDGLHGLFVLFFYQTGSASGVRDEHTLYILTSLETDDNSGLGGYCGN